MALTMVPVKRNFRYAGVSLGDAPPGMSNEDAKAFFAQQYKAILTAEIEVGEVVNGVQNIEFLKHAGTKG